jgi:hypothetical protein
MGIETEYAVTGFGSGGEAVRASHLVARMHDAAGRIYPNLPSWTGRGMFLANGGLFYVDNGSHPEFCTPECDDPSDLVRYVRAGDRILARLARQVREENPSLSRVLITRCNVDYSGQKTSWGCHESYAYRRDQGAMARLILPHLASRIVYTGAGGFDPRSPGLVFALSPRAFFLVREHSEDSMRARGIVHWKNEPLCNGYSRLHLVCGESLCSELASWLKVGTTALVVAMIDGGMDPAPGFLLHSATRAMRAFTKDPTCTATALANHGRVTAIAIQRRYLEAAESRLGAAFMPPWAKDVCGTWRAVLDDLERDPERLSDSLDWAIKKKLYDHRARLAGVDPDSFRVWSAVIPRLMAEVRKSPLRGRRVVVEEILGSGAPAIVRDYVAKATPFLAENGRCWEELRPFVDLRKRLLEVDTRFSQLSDDGIFEALDIAGALRHKVSGVGDIDPAIAAPPPRGRARIRGEVVKRLAREAPGRYVCDWQLIADHMNGESLDLSNPHAESEAWRTAPRPRALRDLRQGLFDL